MICECHAEDLSIQRKKLLTILFILRQSKNALIFKTRHKKLSCGFTKRVNYNLYFKVAVV